MSPVCPPRPCGIIEVGRDRRCRSGRSGFELFEQQVHLTAEPSQFVAVQRGERIEAHGSSRGQLDDLAILSLGMKLFEGLVPENIVATHRAALNRQRDPNAETVDAPGYRVVDDEKPKNKRG